LADDSVVIRRILSKTLEEESDMTVVGVAANGEIAMHKIDQVKPDVLILDIHMPVMGGIELLRVLRTTHPDLPVIVFSSQTNEGAENVMEALNLGAREYVTKPSRINGGSGISVIHEQLAPIIRGLMGRKRQVLEAPKPALPTAEAGHDSSQHQRGENQRRDSASPIDVLAIASSTGGPNALARLMEDIPRNFPIPIVITQHMPPDFTRHLAARLDKLSGISVAEGAEGAPLEPGRAWIAPGGHHMVVTTRGGTPPRITITEDPPENSCRPAADPMFRSVVEVFGANVLAVVLTGMGSDGLIGCRHVVDAGGRVLTQDEDSSVVWGMPGYVTEAGLSDKVLPLERIGPEVTRWVASSRRDQVDTPADA